MNTPLRVLLVLPMYGGSLPVGRYCAAALTRLGHSVEVFEAPDFHPTFEALKHLRVTMDRLAYLQNSFLQVVSQAVLAKAETFEPDLVLSLAQAPLTQQALKRLHRDGVATAMWFVEDHTLFTYWRAFAPFYDYFAVIQIVPFFERLHEIGCDKVLYLPLAADPEFHRPLDLTPVERRLFGSDVSFLGAGYPNRRRAFLQLLGYDLKIWGTEWEDEPALSERVQRAGARISSEDAVKIFNASAVNLNLHSSVRASEAVSPGDFVNPRTFEVAACGGFQLVDQRELMDELFAPGELETFTSLAELKEKIDYYLAHPTERAEVAARARERVLRDHTYERRMDTLLDFIAKDRKGWPRPRGASDPSLADLPEELREQVAALLERLRLRPDVPFADLVAALRREQGKLSDLETSILFLDEWKKQYDAKS
jgi:spore maturation protein CgeB